MSNDTAVMADGDARPAPRGEAPQGKHWAAVPAGREWSVAEPGKTCRFSQGRGHPACGREASVAVSRGIGNPVPWHYCPQDAYARYGVWAENGKVMRWGLEND